MFFLLEHAAHAGQIVGWRDAEGELEGVVVVGGTPKAALKG